MEAAAHYAAVAYLVWPDDESRFQLLAANAPWKGRPSNLPDWDRYGRRLINIDPTHRAIIDESQYLALKDHLWFMRGGYAMRIYNALLLNKKPWAMFSYIKMEYDVFGGLCVHLNGRRLDNRRCNLASLEKVKEVELLRADRIRPLTPAALHQFGVGRHSKHREQFLAYWQRWLAFQDFRAGRLKFWQGEHPQDPRTLPQYEQDYREEIQAEKEALAARSGAMADDEA